MSLTYFFSGLLSKNAAMLSNVSVDVFCKWLVYSTCSPSMTMP